MTASLNYNLLSDCGTTSAQFALRVIMLTAFTAGNDRSRDNSITVLLFFSFCITQGPFCLQLLEVMKFYLRQTLCFPFRVLLWLCACLSVEVVEYELVFILYVKTIIIIN